MTISAGKRLVLGVLFAVVLGILLVLPASRASAHHPIVSGSTSCSADGETVVVTWRLGNSETVEGTNRTMTVNASSVNRGTLVGLAPGTTVAPSGTASGSTTLPSSSVGTVTLAVRVRWTEPGPQDVSGDATVPLPGRCEHPTTTTTATTSTTRPSTSTTAMPAATTTTSTRPTTSTSTSTSTAGPSTSTPTRGGRLVRTGSSAWLLTALGLMAVVVGLVLLAVARRRITNRRESDERDKTDK